eukprot:5864141-Heterocapsa_arctica.AAC.1
MYGRTRLDIQHEKLRSCVKPEKLKAPGARSVPAGTKWEIAKEKLYEYERGIYQRLDVSLHAAYAALDSYLNQLGALQRVAYTDELSMLSPAISSERQACLLSTSIPFRNPSPVTIEQDFKVDSHIICFGAYDKACLNIPTAANGYDYPTIVDNSVINDFLFGEYSKLATYRKGLRWALMTSVRLREPNRFSSLPAMVASDAQW